MTDNSRRRFIMTAGAAGAAAAAGLATACTDAEDEVTSGPDSTTAVLPFRGSHQAGVTAPATAAGLVAGLDLRAETDVFEGLAGHAMVRGILSSDGRPELVAGEVVTANYFDVLGVEPVLGRSFHPDEDETEGTHPVIILSHGFSPSFC